MSSKKYIAGIDIGTTGAKTLITDTAGKPVGLGYREYPCLFPHPGWMEQDVEAMWPKVCESCREAIGAAGIDPRHIASIGISSQRGTFLPVDRNLKPLMNSMVHSDMRAGKQVEWIFSEIGAAEYCSITGLIPTAIWVYPKIKWIIDNQPALFDATYKFLNGQEYFLHKLGAEELCTDPASRTLDGLMDVKRLNWSEKLCGLIGLPMDKLPPMGKPTRRVGAISVDAAALTGFAPGTPLVIGAGDQQCAAIGSGVIAEGMVEITIGTSMVMLAHIDTCKEDPGRKVLIGGSGIPGKWDMEGLYATAGSTLRWWRDVYGQPEKRAALDLGLDVYDLITLEAGKAPAGSKGFLFLPFLYGMLTPHYNHDARGVSLGLSLFHDRRDMARGVLEGITMATNMVVKSMDEVLGKPFEIIRVTGGGSKSAVWNQIQADIYGRPVETLQEAECTALGAAILGACGCGVYTSVEEGVAQAVHRSEKIDPNMGNHRMYQEGYQIFSDTADLLIKSGIYRRAAHYQSEYWK